MTSMVPVAGAWFSVLAALVVPTAHRHSACLVTEQSVLSMTHSTLRVVLAANRAVRTTTRPRAAEALARKSEAARLRPIHRTP